MADNLERAFHEAMLNTYRTALSECQYRATRFVQMVEQQGGVSAARQLLNSPGHPDGLTRLWELGRLDISMEALVLKSQWTSLFTKEELRIARQRLRDSGFRSRLRPSQPRLHPGVRCVRSTDPA